MFYEDVGGLGTVTTTAACFAGSGRIPRYDDGGTLGRKYMCNNGIS